MGATKRHWSIVSRFSIAIIAFGFRKIKIILPKCPPLHQRRLVSTPNSTFPKDLLRSSGLRREKRSLALRLKRLWAYLKEKTLQDPENKQFFTPDSPMAPIFGTERIKCFS